MRCKSKGRALERLSTVLPAVPSRCPPSSPLASLPTRSLVAKLTCACCSVVRPFPFFPIFFPNRFEVLRPEMEKVFELIEFQEHVVNVYAEVVQLLAKDKRKDAKTRRGKVVPARVFECLLSLLDMLIKLDSLKDMKTSLLNDFAIYKRAYAKCKAILQSEELSALEPELHKLQMFMANPRCAKGLILFNLKAKVQGVDGHEEVTLTVIEACVDVIRDMCPEVR